MHASRSVRAKAALMPDLGFPGDLPTRLDDGQQQLRVRALMRITRGKIKPATRAQIGDVARWHGVSVRALHNLEERGITQSERGMNGVRFYDPDQQVRIEAAFALRELGASVDDIRAFLEELAGDRTQAQAYLSRFLERRLEELRTRVTQVSETLELLKSDRAI